MRYRGLFRVNLRLVFVILTVLALGFAFWANQARKQHRFTGAIHKAGGVCKRRPLGWMPEWLRSFVGEDYSSFVVEVSVGGNVAPLPSGLGSRFQGRSVEAVDPTELEQLLSLKAMRNVEALELYGTAVSDDLMLAYVSNLPKLKSLRLHMTSVTQKGAANLSRHLPSCEIAPLLEGSWMQWRDANGPEIVQWVHRDQLHLTKELDLFRRVENGEPEAVYELLRIGAEHQPRDASVALSSLSKATSPEAVAALRDGLADNKTRIRRLAVEALGMLQDFDAVSAGLSDVDGQVRTLCIRYLVQIDRQRAFSALIRATRDEDAQVRWLAIEELSGFDDDETLDALIQTVTHDEADSVRAAAARVLGGTSHLRGIEALKRATQDDSSFVRKHATRALRQLKSLDPTL